MPLPLPLVLGNWKMHGLCGDVAPLAAALAERRRSATQPGTLGLFPPATLLHAVSQACRGPGLVVGGQDCHEQAKGAFTGSISASMLKDCGAKAVIVGHSERRHGLGESDVLVRSKAEAALGAGLVTVLCVGETEREWDEGRTVERLREQLAGSLPDGATADTLVVAYEPVWAIGTGRTAERHDIERAHEAIRGRLDELVAGGAGIPIVYGGSVKAANAAAILALPVVDGVLVGGASLDLDGFWSIFEAGSRA